jgi:SET domain-containing protein
MPMILTYIRTPLGGFINHSEKPNCVLDCTQDWDDYLIYNIITKRAIAEGEELLLDYNV